MSRTCSECHYLRQTSPEQRFHLCEFWSCEGTYPVPGAGKLYGYDYAITHCHLQPEAPACPFFRKPEVTDDAHVQVEG